MSAAADPAAQKWRDAEIDGQRFKVKAWKTRDRRAYLAKLNELKALQLEKQYDAILEYMATQTDQTKEQLEELDSITCDKLFSAIATNNAAPLAQPTP